MQCYFREISFGCYVCQTVQLLWATRNFRGITRTQVGKVTLEIIEIRLTILEKMLEGGNCDLRVFKKTLLRIERNWHYPQNVMRQ